MGLTEATSLTKELWSFEQSRGISLHKDKPWCSFPFFLSAKSPLGCYRDEGLDDADTYVLGFGRDVGSS